MTHQPLSFNQRNGGFSTNARCAQENGKRKAACWSGFFRLYTCILILWSAKRSSNIINSTLLNFNMSINQEYLWEVLNYVWEDGMTELEVQRKYFSILEKELKGEDRLYLETVYKTIEELELKDPPAFVPKNEFVSMDRSMSKK